MILVHRSDPPVKSQKPTEPHGAIRRRKVSSMLLRGMNAFEIFEALR